MLRETLEVSELREAWLGRSGHVSDGRVVCGKERSEVENREEERERAKRKWRYCIKADMEVVCGRDVVRSFSQTSGHVLKQQYGVQH